MFLSSWKETRLLMTQFYAQVLAKCPFEGYYVAIGTAVTRVGRWRGADVFTVSKAALVALPSPLPTLLEDDVSLHASCYHILWRTNPFLLQLKKEKDDIATFIALFEAGLYFTASDTADITSSAQRAGSLSPTVCPSPATSYFPKPWLSYG
jgi:hypothetical protein